jgi:hypothetical protein
MPINPGDNVDLSPGTIKDIPRANGATVGGEARNVDAPPNPFVPRHLRKKTQLLVELDQAGRLRTVPAWHLISPPKSVVAAKKALDAACDELAGAEEAYKFAHPSDRAQEEIALAEGQQAAGRARVRYDSVVTESLAEWAPLLAKAAQEQRAEAAKAAQEARAKVQGWMDAHNGAKAATEKLHGVKAWVPKSRRGGLAKEATEGLSAAVTLLTTDDVALSGRYLEDAGNGDVVPEWVAEHLSQSSRNESRMALGIAEAKGVLTTNYTTSAADFPTFARYASQWSHAETLEFLRNAVRQS